MVVSLHLNRKGKEYASQDTLRFRLVEFLEYKSKAAMKILPNAGQVILKAPEFTNGTVEFDFEPLDLRFASVFFRWQNANASECFYFRTARARAPTAMDAVQYAPYLGGINLWGMLGHFQSHATCQARYTARGPGS